MNVSYTVMVHVHISVMWKENSVIWCSLMSWQQKQLFCEECHYVPLSSFFFFIIIIFFKWLLSNYIYLCPINCFFLSHQHFSHSMFCAALNASFKMHTEMQRLYKQFQSLQFLWKQIICKRTSHIACQIKHLLIIVRQQNWSHLQTWRRWNPILAARDTWPPTN